MEGSVPQSDVKIRKARFQWLRQELGMTNGQIAEILGRAMTTVRGWGADSRPDAAPPPEAIEALKDRLLSDARFEARVANAQLARLEAAFVDGGCPVISRARPIADEEMAFEKRQVARSYGYVD
jgi:hypothetical protein